MIKIIKIYFFINTVNYLKNKKNKKNKIIYSIIKNMYMQKKSNLINKYVSNVYNIFRFFNTSYGMNVALFNVFFKKFINY